MAAIDPITLEVYWNRLITVMDETDRALVRTAFSVIIGEGRDFGVVLLDHTGTSLAQSVLSSTLFTVTLPRTTKSLLQHFPPETLRDGDVLITNDPWIGTGHLPDVCVVRPVFHGGRLVGFIACAAHVSDIGGSISYFDQRDVFEEGLRIPPMKLFDAGRPNEDLIEVIRANVRVPDMVWGDLMAILSAEHVGAERLREFLSEYGMADLSEIAANIAHRSEEAMRRALRAIPDGTYSFAVSIDGYREPGRIAAAVTVDGDRLRVDFTGTSPETWPGAVNAPLNPTLGDVLTCLKAALIPELPNNEALFRPIEVTVPEGCILNCRFPAAVKGRSATTIHAHAAVYGALAQAVPDQVQSASGSFWALIASGQHPDGRPFNAWIILNGGMGAKGRMDGRSAIYFPANGIVTPTEVFETVVPLLIECKELRPDSAGAGRHRGGLGQRMLIRTQGGARVTLTMRPSHRRYPPVGLLGGDPGAPGRILLNGQECSDLVVTLGPGDELSVEMPGGGGFGAPREREAGLVSRDRELGYTGGR